MEPSDFYGNNLPTIQSSPNIPVQDISSLTMTYQYTSSDSQVQVEIDAVLVEPNNWQKTVVIVPQETEKGNFSINWVSRSKKATLSEQIGRPFGAKSATHPFGPNTFHKCTCLFIPVNIIPIICNAKSF